MMNEEGIQATPLYLTNMEKKSRQPLPTATMVNYSKAFTLSANLDCDEEVQWSRIFRGMEQYTWL